MLHAPIGTPVRQCIAAAQPNITDYCVIVGGPMMGKPLTTDEAIDAAVVTKTTGNLIVLPRDHYLIRKAQLSMETIRHQAKSACIQCRMCTDLCPRFLIGHSIHPNKVMRNLWREPTITDNAEYEAAFGEAVNCCSCGACEMFSCPMGLSPRKVNDYLKIELRNRGINVPRNMKPEATQFVDMRKVPTERLISRLGLSQYAVSHAHTCLELVTDEVTIPFSQHIGKPAQPVFTEGSTVTKGDVIAQAAEGGLSANIHASVSGTVIGVTPTGMTIRRRKE